jgi:hypothetical protein
MPETTRRTGEARQEERLTVDVPCEVAGYKGRRPAKTRDLSPGGCCVLTRDSYAPDDTVECTLRGPFSGRRLDLPAQVRWVRVGASPTPFMLGCQFVLTPRARKELNALLREVNAAPAPAPPPEADAAEEG